MEKLCFSLVRRAEFFVFASCGEICYNGEDIKNKNRRQA